MSDAVSHQPGREATLYLRLEGPLQAWGGRAIGRIRRTESVPTKSGVIGLLGAALGRSRHALNAVLPELDRLRMAVRVDRAGHIEEDYHTVGAGIGMLTADGQVKRTAATGEIEAVVSPREYLVDASFLVMLHGPRELIGELAAALQSPRWPLFLGRKRCVPATPVFAGVAEDLTLAEALRRDGPADPSLVPIDLSATVRVVSDLLEPETFGDLAGVSGEELAVRFEEAKAFVTDRLIRLDPPVHAGRVVLDFEMPRPQSRLERPDLTDPLFGVAGPDRPQRANDRDARQAARGKSAGRCLFCRFEVADPRELHAHHLTYDRRGRERVNADRDEIGDDDFVMLCRECHAAVTLLEYQAGFGRQRIDPREPRWRSRIWAARESRRRQENPVHPAIGLPADVPAPATGAVSALFESVIPLKAGSSFPADAPGNRWLENRHHVHQRLSMAFPEAGGDFAAPGYGVTRDEGGFLYHIESGPRARILVRSRLLPDWGRAFGNAAWLIRGPIPAPRLLDAGGFSPGIELSFRLEANPVKRLREEGPEGKKGARVPLRTADALHQWIHHRAAEGGFQILEETLSVERLGRQTARMKSAPHRHWDAVRFAGRLRVTDADAFAIALTTGLGPAKAFGFGMLCITDE